MVQTCAVEQKRTHNCASSPLRATRGGIDKNCAIERTHGRLGGRGGGGWIGSARTGAECCQPSHTHTPKRRSNPLNHEDDQPAAPRFTSGCLLQKSEDEMPPPPTPPTLLRRAQNGWFNLRQQAGAVRRQLFQLLPVRLHHDVLCLAREHRGLRGTILHASVSRSQRVLYD